MNVPDFLNPRKEPGGSLYIGLILILVAVTSFGLGRLSRQGGGQAGLRVLYPEGMAEMRLDGAAGAAASFETRTGAATTSGQIVASKSGTKYHFTWCSGAKSIKEENRIYFASTQEARAAGYEPASNCKGLQ